MSSFKADPRSFTMWDQLIHQSGTHIICIQGVWRMNSDVFGWLRDYNRTLENPFVAKLFGKQEYRIYDIPVQLVHNCPVPELVFKNNRRWA